MPEIQIGAAVLALGALVFTLLCKVGIPIVLGEFTVDSAAKTAPAPSPATEDKAVKAA
jgi:hypothetical protein